MPSMNKRYERPAPGVAYSEIHIDDETNPGTGTYSFALERQAVAENSSVSDTIVKKPEFQLSINLKPATRQLFVYLGKADGSPPLSGGMYLVPSDLSQGQLYVFRAAFREWKLLGVTVNGVDLIREAEKLN